MQARSQSVRVHVQGLLPNLKSGLVQVHPCLQKK